MCANAANPLRSRSSSPVREFSGGKQSDSPAVGEFKGSTVEFSSESSEPRAQSHPLDGIIDQLDAEIKRCKSSMGALSSSTDLSARKVESPTTSVKMSDEDFESKRGLKVLSIVELLEGLSDDDFTFKLENDFKACFGAKAFDLLNDKYTLRTDPISLVDAMYKHYLKENHGEFQYNNSNKDNVDQFFAKLIVGGHKLLQAARECVFSQGDDGSQDSGLHELLLGSIDEVKGILEKVLSDNRTSNKPSSESVGEPADSYDADDDSSVEDAEEYSQGSSASDVENEDAEEASEKATPAQPSKCPITRAKNTLLTYCSCNTMMISGAAAVLAVLMANAYVDAVRRGAFPPTDI